MVLYDSYYMATVQQVPRYPLDKDQAGNAAWKVLHNFAAQYPDEPTAEDKREFHSLLKSVLRTIPEGDCKCRSHAVEYIRKNTPTMNSKKELVEYVCNFHNDVNRRNQKPVIDCKLLLDNTAECESCKVKPLPKKVVEAADVDGPLKQTMGDYKKLSVKVIEELCKKEGLPVPRIIFAPCPTAQQTSCNIMIKDKDDIIIKEGDKAPIIYMNPTNFGLRVLVHEMREYYRQMKNSGRYLPKDEESIEKDTQEIIAKYFPRDEYDANAKKLVAPLVMKDESVAPTVDPKVETSVKTLKPMEPSKKVNTFMEKNTTLLRGRNAFSASDAFPMFSKYRQEQEKAEEEQHRIDAEGGILSHLDGLFEPVAKVLNVKPRDVNMATTPTIFSEGSQLAIRSQFSELGSLVMTTLLGMGLVTVTAFNKDNISTADRRMLTQLAGLYLWSGLRSASSPEMLVEAQAVGTALSKFDFGSVPIFMVKSNSFLASFVAPEGGDPRTMKRGQQRKEGKGSKLGGGPLGGGQSVGGPVGSEIIQQRVGPRQEASEQVMERIKRRAAGEAAPSESVNMYRDFPSGAGPRMHPSISAAGPGVGVPRIDSSGGVGFTYVPTITPAAISNDERDLLEAMGLPADASSAYPARFYPEEEEDDYY